MIASQEQLGDLRQKIGVLEGNLQAVTANRDTALNEIKAVHAQLADAIAQLSLARAEADRWRLHEEQAQLLVTQLRAAATKPARKSKAE